MAKPDTLTPISVAIRRRIATPRCLHWRVREVRTMQVKNVMTHAPGTCGAGDSANEAARIAYGIGKPDSGAIPAADQPTNAEPADSLDAWQQQLRAIDEKLAASGAGEGLINEDIISLLSKRTDLIAEIKTEQRFQEREAKASAAERENAAAQVNASHREVKAEALKRFPSITIAGSEVQKEADRLTRLYGGSALMSDPTAPMQIAEQAAMAVARAKAAANGTSIAIEFAKLEAQASAAPPAVKTGAAKKIMLASGAQATQRPDQPATEQDKFREAQATLDPRAQHEALNRLLYGT